MKRIVIMFALCVALVSVSGCSKPTSTQVADVINNNKPLILRTLQAAGTQGAKLGLAKWAEKKPEAAKEAATALSKNIDEKILPYLNGGNLGASDQVSALIDSSLFVNVPDEVKLAVQAAAAVLDIYLPIPGANTGLDADQVDYLKAFMTGLRNGCDSFLGVKEIKEQRYWIKK